VAARRIDLQVVLVLIAVVPQLWAVLVGAAVLGVGTAFLTPAVLVAIFGAVPTPNGAVPPARPASSSISGWAVAR
jgi:hypothetical protein